MAVGVIKLQFLLYSIQYATSQYDNQNNMYYQNPAQHYYQQSDQVDYGEPQTDYRRQWMRSEYTLRNSGGELPLIHEEAASSEEDCSSKCSCSICDYRIPCCAEMCANICNSGMSGTAAYPQRVPSPGQSSLVFVPYPYPLIVPGIERGTTTESNLLVENQEKVQTITSTTPSTTTTTSTTQLITSTPMKSESRLGSVDEFNNLILNRARKNIRPVNNRYMLTSLRRTRPTWVPKYGIIPIPDNLAEKLLSQLREVKGVNNRYRPRKSGFD